MSAAQKKAEGRRRKKKELLRITLTKSPIGYSYPQRRTVRALGLRRMHQTVEQEDTPVLRGMIAKVKHLVTVEKAE
jgi:large subunit ribosomal protein L30